MNLDQILTDIGLSDKEAKMYLILLQYGNQPTSFLAKKGELNRGTAYVILHQLVDKGLATKSTKKKVQYFSPLEPQNLIGYLDRQKQSIESGRDKINTMMGEFEALRNPLTAKPKMVFFEGTEGARTVLEQTLQGEARTLRTFMSIEDLIRAVGPDFYHAYDKKRIKYGLKLEAISSRAQNSVLAYDPEVDRHQTNVKEVREVRYVGKDMHSPLTMFLFDNKLAIISTREENFSVVIESQELVNMQKQFFQALWNSLDQSKIKVGILHSHTGTMAISERPLVDGIMMAIDEINEAGGIHGKTIEPVIRDAKSDPKVFGEEARKLITVEGVSTVFGGWTSSSRQALRPVFEKYNHLLWYPVEYEGLESSPNIVYTGSAPNQHLLPAVDFALKKLGKKFLLVGSDYIYPWCAHEILKGHIKEKEGDVVGEYYEVLGGENFKPLLALIKKHNPDVILNTVNGDSNVALFESLRKADLKVKVISFSIGEEEVDRMDKEALGGHYACFSYFQSLKNNLNKKFVQNFKKRYGKHRVVDDPIQASYNSVYLFAKAAEMADSSNVIDIRDATKGLEIEAPEGKIKIDEDNQHLYRFAHIGQLQEDGQFKVVWSSENRLKPEPHPSSKSHKEWEAFMSQF